MSDGESGDFGSPNTTAAPIHTHGIQRSVGSARVGQHKYAESKAKKEDGSDVKSVVDFSLDDNTANLHSRRRFSGQRPGSQRVCDWRCPAAGIP